MRYRRGNLAPEARSLLTTDWNSVKNARSFRTCITCVWLKLNPRTMLKAAAQAVAACHTWALKRCGKAEITAKRLTQNRNGDQNCISMGQRVPGIHTSDEASSPTVGATTQAAIRRARP